MREAECACFPFSSWEIERLIVMRRIQQARDVLGSDSDGDGPRICDKYDGVPDEGDGRCKFTHHAGVQVSTDS